MKINHCYVHSMHPSHSLVGSTPRYGVDLIIEQKFISYQMQTSSFRDRIEANTNLLKLVCAARLAVMLIIWAPSLYSIAGVNCKPLNIICICILGFGKSSRQKNTYHRLHVLWHLNMKEMAFWCRFRQARLQYLSNRFRSRYVGNYGASPVKCTAADPRIRVLEQPDCLIHNRPTEFCSNARFFAAPVQVCVWWPSRLLCSIHLLVLFASGFYLHDVILG